jgi:hypothetical protein
MSEFKLNEEFDNTIFKVKFKDKGRAYFKVTDDRLNAFIKGWANDRFDAEQEIHSYLKRVVGTLGAEVPFFKTDDQGYVTQINFRYGMGFFHTGWRGVNNSNWLEPETEEVRSDLRALPPLPSRDLVNKAINWPLFEEKNNIRAWYTEGYDQFVNMAKNAVKVSLKGDHAYISVPRPESYQDIPEMEKEIFDWRPPEGLEQIDQRLGEKIEARYDFYKSPLGQVINSAKRKFSL